MSSEKADISERELANIILRNDLLSFVARCVQELLGGNQLEENWHLEVIAAELQNVISGQTKRLIINLPPRHLKSLVASVALPAWLLGRDPAAQILCVSYGQDLATKFARDTRQIMSARWYQKLFPGTRLDARNQGATDFATTRGGFRKATSVGGVLTGRGADFIIIDDPLKAEEAYSETARTSVEEWFGRTLVSRLNSKARGAIVVVMQRLHEDDLSGVLLRKGGWRHICLPALAEADEEFRFTSFGGTSVRRRKKGDALHAVRESPATLAALRHELGEAAFSAQYQQAPLPATGNMIKTEWLRFYEPHEMPDRFDLTFQSWDTANKLTDDSDYSVCTTWGCSGGRTYLLDVFRDRVDFPTLCRVAISLQQAHCASTVLIEDKASGIQLLQELRSRGMFVVKGIEPDADKITRMQGQSVLIENGAVLLPTKAPWLTEFVRELTAFPRGRHDDQVDSTSQALCWFNPRDAEPGILAYYKRKLAARSAVATE